MIISFTFQVVEEGQLTNIKEEMEDFLQEIYPLLVTSPTLNDPTQRSDAHLALVIDFFSQSSQAGREAI